jgi:hypothetical protein
LSVSTIAVIVFFIYRYIIRVDRVPRVTLAPADQPAGSLLKCDLLT